jgi:peptidoglycan/xylan/chitin deacetylase (PgdA/CDA1 family)
VLAKCPPEQLKDELTSSKALIEREIGRPVSFFAYPNGLPADINDSAVAAVQAAGYAAGLVVSGRLVGDHEDLMRLGRIAAPANLDSLRWVLSGAAGR